MALKVWLSRAFVLLLLVNALDLSTSLIPYWIDSQYQPPPRSALEWSVQLGLLVAGMAYLGRYAGPIVRTLTALPMPRGALLVCGAFIAIEVAHIALRYERYPFSPVAMFSDAHLDAPVTREQPALLIKRPDGALEIFSFQREGDPRFARYFRDLDYKASAALRMYRDAPRVHEIVAETIESHGLPAPEPVYVTYRATDGKVLEIRPRVPQPAQR